MYVFIYIYKNILIQLIYEGLPYIRYEDYQYTSKLSTDFTIRASGLMELIF